MNYLQATKPKLTGCGLLLFKRNNNKFSRMNHSHLDRYPHIAVKQIICSHGATQTTTYAKSIGRRCTD